MSVACSAAADGKVLRRSVMNALALAMSAFASLSFTSITGLDSNEHASLTWLGQHGPANQTSVFRTSIHVSDANYIGVPLVLTVLVADQATGGGTGGVFCGFDLDFIKFDYDGIFGNENEFGSPAGAVVVPGAHPSQPPYIPTALHPGPLFGLDAGGLVMEDVATLGAMDANYRAGSITVDTCGGWVSLGDGGRMVATYNITLESDTLYVYVGDAGQRSYTLNGQTYNEDPLVAIGVETFGVPEPATLAMLLAGAGAAVARRGGGGRRGRKRD
jgi:hypothetical protein